MSIWFDGWHEAHAAIVPEALTRLRTRESLRDRLRAELLGVRVGDEKGVVGFTMLRGAEVYQFYAAASARGTGAAAALTACRRARAGSSSRRWR